MPTPVGRVPTLSSSPGLRAQPAGAALRALAHPTHHVGAALAALPARRLFYADAGLGANSPHADMHFIRHKLSTDTASAIRALIKFDIEGGAAKLKAYREAFRKVHGRMPENREILDRRPWEVLKFADRSVLDQAGTPYVNYYRQAARTAHARGGKVHFYLGGLSAGEYIASIVRTEARERKPFDAYAASVDFNTLVGRKPGNDSLYLWDSREGASQGTAASVVQPTITTVELYDSTSGAFKETGRSFRYFSQNGKAVDTARLLELQEQVLEEARKPWNAVLAAENKEMTSPARELLQELQKLFDGVGPRARSGAPASA